MARISITETIIAGQSAVELDIRIVMYPLDSSALMVYYQYYDANGHPIVGAGSEGNLELSGSLISASTNTTLIGVLTAKVGAFTMGTLLMNQLEDTHHKFEYTKDGGRSVAVVTGNYITSAEYASIQVATLSALGIAEDVYDRTIYVMPTTDDGRYNSFGTLITVSSTKKMYVFRSGTSHTENGRIDIIDYNTQTKTWGNRRTVFGYTAPNDCRDPRGGFINGRVYIFFVRRRRDLSSGEDMTNGHGYVRSTDATATAWEPFVSLPMTLPFTTPWGTMVKGDVAGTYYMPFWDSELAVGGTFKVGFHKTVDNGETWTQHYAYSGTDFHATESWMVNMGSGRLLFICRLEKYWGLPGGLGQMVSLDGGATWSALAATNMGSTTTVHVPWVYYHAAIDKVTVFYQSRSSGYIMISPFNAPANILNNPLGWITPVQYEYNYQAPNGPIVGLGYGDYDGRLSLWAKENSASAVVIKVREEDLSPYMS